MLFTPYEAWCLTVALLKVSWIARRRTSKFTEWIAAAFFCGAACTAGLVLRQLGQTFSEQSSSETAINILALILTLISAYGVYVSMLVDAKLQRMTEQVSELERKLEHANENNLSLTRDIERSQARLDSAVAFGRVERLRHQMLVLMPNDTGANDARRVTLQMVRGILRDAVGRQDPALIEFDCNEVEAVCRANGFAVQEVLKEAMAPYGLYRQMAASGIFSDDFAQQKKS